MTLLLISCSFSYHRLSKHHLQHVLQQCQLTGSRGHDLSMARQILLSILVAGKKDQELMQVGLLNEPPGGTTNTGSTQTKLYKQRPDILDLESERIVIPVQQKQRVLSASHLLRLCFRICKMLVFS